MRILLYTQYFSPETNAPANRWDYFTNYLKNKGHEITVLTSYPNHPQRKIFQGYKNRFRTIENKDGIKIIRCYTYISPSVKFIPRLLNYLSFSFSSYLNSLSLKRFDLIIVSIPPIFVGFTGLKIAKRLKVPLVLDLRDLWPEAAEETGYLKKGSLYYYTLNKARNLYQKATVILVNSPALKEDLICSYGISSNKIFYIPNGADLEFFRNDYDTKEIEEKYNLKNKFVVLYTGIIGFAQGIETIIKTANLLKEKNEIVFLIVGSGPKEEEIKNLVKELRLTNVILTGQRPREEMPYFVSRADVCLATYKNSPVFKKNIPSKIFDYMASGKPIIVNLEGEASEIILSAQAGLLSLPEDPESLKEAILKIYESPILKEKMGESALIYARQYYDKKVISENLEEILNYVSKI